jgi:hypothetical protein
MVATVYPTGTTIYDPGRCWNGYNVFQTNMHAGVNAAAVLIDMNGNIVNLWKRLDGFPNKMLPGGFIMGSTGMRDPKYGFQDMLDLVQVDWEGNIVWQFGQYELIQDPELKPRWMARQHHDYQREGNPVGYYVPGMNPLVNRGNTIILSHRNLRNTQISEKPLLDDVIIEVTWEGEKVWEWVCSDHFDEMNFSEEAKNTLARNPDMRDTAGDWMHINSVSALGPNRWYDQGDARFHPDNLIWSGRETNIMAIIDKKTGKIVWQIGPDYNTTPALKKLGWIIGQHHAHLIPHGLPGEGNILIFDNGGQAGYGSPNPGSPSGVHNALRDYSRVLEIDPITLEVVWKCGGSSMPGGSERPIFLYSSFISSAQRLPNGNTLITEGASGRIIEVTPDLEIVWEYISPYFNKHMNRDMNMVYRAYRLPYEWIPQVTKPVEKVVQRQDNSKFRVPGSLRGKVQKRTMVRSRRQATNSQAQYCVVDRTQQEEEPH